MLMLVVLSCAASSAPQRATQSQAAFAEPALSPDGSEIAFVSGGDIWTVAAAGGEAQLLVSHAATESRPLYSPDGRRLAFGSTRTGNGDVYILAFDTGEVRRLTFDDSNDQLDGWSSDGRWIYFSSTSRDTGGADVYRVSSDGGTPLQVSANEAGNADVLVRNDLMVQILNERADGDVRAPSVRQKALYRSVHQLNKACSRRRDRLALRLFFANIIRSS